MLSKIDAGTLPLKREKVDLYTVLNLAADNLNDLLRKNHITVEIPENGCIEFWGGFRVDNGSPHQSHKKLYGTFQTGRRRSIVTTQAILSM